jgi:hypothetical protein
MLDVDTGKPKLTEKRAKVSPLVDADARLKSARPMTTTSHQSWADVVKLRSPKDLKGARKSLLKS